MAADKALITGITGQDGSYLAELLLDKGYEVHGLIRRASTFNTSRIDHLYQDPHAPDPQLHLHYGDITDGTRLTTLLDDVRPHEIYHLGGPVARPRLLRRAGVHRQHHRARHHPSAGGRSGHRPATAASTRRPVSEMFGASPPPQDENTPFSPRSPYGAAKVYAYWITRNYREAYGLYAVNGILFNHESPRRGPTFVTRKITAAAARIKAGQQQHLYLGNLDARRDWGYAPEYVYAMWLMLQQPTPRDYTIATGTSYSVAEFAHHCFNHLDLDPADHIRHDPRYLRPTEVDHLIGNPSQAGKDLNWQAETHTPQLAKIMTAHELDALTRPPLTTPATHT